jgi:hypothetical protein
MTSNLNRPETIPGYIEPEEPKPLQINTGSSKQTINRSGYGIYKTFDDKAKGKKKEEFKTTELVDKYGNNNYEKDEETEMCPICSEIAVYTCYCVYNDKKCSNDHVWYLERNGKIKVGNPHK